jgi:hypothetical protein
MTSRRPVLPDSERIGDKSMAGKRGMSEDVYGMVLQRLRDMVKAELPCATKWHRGMSECLRSMRW